MSAAGAQKGGAAEKGAHQADELASLHGTNSCMKGNDREEGKYQGNGILFSVRCPWEEKTGRSLLEQGYARRSPE